MARPGVSYLDVAQAANAIQATNEYPSIERIRQKLGTGSSTTIANHLKQWKAEHMPSVIDAPKTTLPIPLLTQIQSFWDELRRSAQNEFEQKEANYQSEIERLSVALKTQTDELESTKSISKEQGLQIKNIEDKFTELQKRLSIRENEVSKLQSKCSTLNQMLENKNETITSLQDQLNKVTSSLEYFHTAAQKQRDEETLKHASQVNQLEQTIQQLNQQKQADNERYQQLLLEHERSGFKVEQLELDTNQAKSQLISKIEESATLKTKLEDSNALVSSLQSNIDQKDQALKELHKLELQHKEIQLKLQQLESENAAKDEALAKLKTERDKLAQENDRLMSRLDIKCSK